MRLGKYLLFIRNSKGLTLIEVLVTASLIVFISTLVIRNIAQTRLDVARIANVVASDVRLAESLALSTKTSNGQIRCGYGISQIDSGRYVIYAGPPTTSGCGGSKQYNPAQESIIYKTVTIDPRADMVDNPKFSDVFYEPPDPKTTVLQGGSPAHIIIKKLGTTKQTCDNSSNVYCMHVCVYDSGRVEVTRGPNCP